MLWQYLRTKVRDSILAGCADALQEIEGGANGELTEAAVLLRARLQPQLPGPTAAEAPTPTLGHMAEDAGGNGRRRKGS